MCHLQKQYVNSSIYCVGDRILRCGISSGAQCIRESQCSKGWGFDSRTFPGCGQMGLSVHGLG